ncbi:MAG: transglutaminase-like domain-containing protein [Clostridiales bacterium]|nr:transglutaminase-like domain-containing protein [Clostridiales bacterium]
MSSLSRLFTLLAIAITSLPLVAITRDEAISFLYKYMSLPDSAEYSREFYLENIDASLRARREMPWGETVPEREFMHFVLPVRVNNENLDHFRTLFYEELKERVKGLSMEEAILEVNHWCHEKVTYKPSDGRTSSPVSSISQAIGRCGEESTFGVAALRAVGIPARQIYTPRWAHTDDNHAWVEAWANGRWYFLGACEPEAVLNLAWFNAPASRGMLMNTNVYGVYDGPEEILLRQPLSTRINVTANYAPVDTLTVMVVHPDGTPAAGADVSFCIYNYAEFYPAVRKTANDEGLSFITAGLGDIIVWASDGKNYGIAKGRPGNESTGREPLKVILDKDADHTGIMEVDIVPPASGAALPIVTQQQRDYNELRLHQEDSIRNAYMATFATAEDSRDIARQLGVDEESLVTILTESRGNHSMIVETLKTLPASKRATAIDMLLNVTEKDRRDIAPEVIIDVVNHVVPNTSGNKELYDRYILSPRVEIEYLRPWRKMVSDRFRDNAAKFRKNPQLIAQWIGENITPADEENPMRLRMSPIAVLNSGKADAISRNILFVAIARSVGIPARIDPVTGTTQYTTDGTGWTDVDFGMKTATDTAVSSPRGSLKITYKPDGYIIDPKYYNQFSLSKITNGVASLLEFDEGETVSSLFNEPYELEAGQYILTSGQRLADGGVLARSEILHIQPGKTTEKELVIRQDNNVLSVIGSLNAENIYHDIATDSDKSLLSTTGRGYYVLGLIAPNHEPSTHALNDISAVADKFGPDSPRIMLLLDDAGKAARFDKNIFPGLPENVVIGIDNDGASRDEIVKSLHLDNPAYPIFVIADTFNRIVWVSNGYTIGIGDTILKTLSHLK